MRENFANEIANLLLYSTKTLPAQESALMSFLIGRALFVGTLDIGVIRDKEIREEIVCLRHQFTFKSTRESLVQKGFILATGYRGVYSYTINSLPSYPTQEIPLPKTSICSNETHSIDSQPRARLSRSEEVHTPCSKCMSELVSASDIHLLHATCTSPEKAPLSPLEPPITEKPRFQDHDLDYTRSKYSLGGGGISLSLSHDLVLLPGMFIQCACARGLQESSQALFDLRKKTYKRLRNIPMSREKAKEVIRAYNVFKVIKYLSALPAIVEECKNTMNCSVFSPGGLLLYRLEVDWMPALYTPPVQIQQLSMRKKVEKAQEQDESQELAKRTYEILDRYFSYSEETQRELWQYVAGTSAANSFMMGEYEPGKELSPIQRSLIVEHFESALASRAPP